MHTLFTEKSLDSDISQELLIGKNENYFEIYSLNHSALEGNLIPFYT